MRMISNPFTGHERRPLTVSRQSDPICGYCFNLAKLFCFEENGTRLRIRPSPPDNIETAR